MIPGKQFSPYELLAIARRRKWVAIAPFLAVTIATAITAAKLPNRYRSETVILVVPQRVPESYVKSTVTARIEDRLQSISQQILSRTRLERIILDFNLYAAQRKTGIMEDVVDQMRTAIDVQVVKGDAFRVSFTGDEPRSVMKVTERLASLFIEENLRDRAVLAQDSYEFLETQLEEARRQLVEHEKKLEEYRRKHTGELPTQLESNLQVIQNTQVQIQTLTESMARDRDRRLMLERLIADATTTDAAAPAQAPVATVDAAPAAGSVFQQLQAAKQVLAQLQLRLTPEHPDVLRAKRMVGRLEAAALAEPSEIKIVTDPALPGDATKRNRSKELAAELDQLDRQLAKKESEEKRLRAFAERYQARVEVTPTRESEMTELTRDYETLQRTYTGLLVKKEDSKLAANLERRQIGEQFKMLDPARVPEKPFSPDRIRIDLMGALLGLGLGIGLVALLEFNDTTLRTDDDVLQALALPVVAQIPVIVTARDRRAKRRWQVLALLSSCAVLLLVSAGVLVWKFR